MDVYEAIHSRHTVRDFSPHPIEESTLKRILNAGLSAPTNDHLRSWEFVIVNDPARRVQIINKVRKDPLSADEVNALLDNWGMVDTLQRQMYLDGVPKQYRMLLTAGALIFPFFRSPGHLLQPESLSALNNFASIWCCVENILIAAAAEGIFGVTRIPFDAETEYIKAELHAPADYEFPCYLALGYPAENAPAIRQLTISVEERMHFNQW